MSATKKGKEVGEHNYKIQDVVLAKIRGFPPWPGQIVDPDKVPPIVAKERQISKKTKFYCVRFFPAGDYAWVVSKDLSLLQKHEIEAYINEPHKKSGDLLSGYKVALDPTEWETKMAEEQAEATAAEADMDIDQLDEGDEDDEDDDEPKKKSKKRKRESEVKPRKKESIKKAETPDPKDKKASPKKRGGKKNGIRSKENIESEDDGAEEAAGEDESSKKAGPPAKKAKKEKPNEDGEFAHLANNPDAVKVKEWRHRLQRAFLSKTVPKSEEMPEYDQLMTTIEQHELTIEQLQFSKLGKVMRHISQLDEKQYPIPNNDEFNIRKRADTLLEKWQSLIQAAGTAGSVAGEAPAPSSVNGAKAEKDDATDPTSTALGPEDKPAVNGKAESKRDGPAKTEGAPPAETAAKDETVPLDATAD